MAQFSAFNDTERVDRSREMTGAVGMKNWKPSCSATAFAGAVPELRCWQQSAWSTPTASATAMNCGSGFSVVTGMPEFPDAAALDPDGPIEDIEKVLGGIDGRFSLLAVGLRRAVVSTDALGCGGVYLTVRRGRAFVASHLGLMFDVLAELGDIPPADPVGLASAALGSVSVDGRTALEGVRRLTAGEYAVIELSGSRQWSVSRYFDPRHLIESGASSSGTELLEMVREAASRAGAIDALLLTGGYDSFAIGALLDPRVRVGMTAITYGGKSSTDRLGASGAAAVLGMKHLSLQIPIGDGLRHADRVSGLTRGSSGLQTTQHLAGSILAARHARHAFSGFLGDILSGKPYNTTADPTELAIQRCTAWSTGLSESSRTMMAPEIAEIRNSLLKQMRSMPGTDEENAILLDLTHRQAHWIAGTFDLMQQSLPVSTPFFTRSALRAAFRMRQPAVEKRRNYEQQLKALGHGSRANSKSRRNSYATIDWTAERTAWQAPLRQWVDSIPDARWRAIA